MDSAFVKKMAESDGMRKTQSELCRSQSTMCSPSTIFFIKSKSEYVTEKLSMCCCNKDERTEPHEKNITLMVFRGLQRERMTL